MVHSLARWIRAFFLGGASLTLSACIVDPATQRHGAVVLNGPGPATAAPATPHVAILLPLTGSNAAIGQALLHAAQLSLSQPGSPVLDQYDTAGTPDGAAQAARKALAAGAGMILGPLTAPETAAVAPLARPANVPVLAFTSDEAQAQPGVWVLGITPAQQVRRLVLAARADNRSRIAAVLPLNPFGDALASGLLAIVAREGLPEPRIARTSSDFAALTEIMKTVSDYTARQAVTPPGPPPMDALLLGLNGPLLDKVVPMLGFYGIEQPQVRILGPATWAREAARQPKLAGAWFAAPDLAGRAAFEQAYTAKNDAAPRDFASLAYDAAGIARAIAGPAGFAAGRLTSPAGYMGADGLIVLGPDGQVRRGLAVFEVEATGAHVIQPAPPSFDAPGT